MDREYVVAAIANAADAQAVAGRLLANQEHIGNAIVPFYGDPAGQALAELLKQHILVAVELIEAAKTGDQDSSPTPTGAGTKTPAISPRSSARPIPTGPKMTWWTCSAST